MADRAEYARKGIARGRSLVVLQYADGIVFVGENPSRALHKFSEIYDRIGFAAAGKYNEYENLRIGGVRYADLRGYTYDRDDVTARGLANVYAQTLGTIFSSAAEKPYEVELVVAEVGETPEGDQIYRLPHDGSIVDEHGSVAVGGNAEQISTYLDQRHQDGMTLAEALRLAVQALSRDTTAVSGRSPPSAWRSRSWTVRVRRQRKFKRIVGRQLSRLLEGDGSVRRGGAHGTEESEDDGVVPSPDPCLRTWVQEPGRPPRPGAGRSGRVRGGGPWSRGRPVRRACHRCRAYGPPGRPGVPACRCSPKRSAASRTVVSSGSSAVARARSSKPVTETSSGIRSPSRRAALQAPAASMSSSQTSAVGRGPGAGQGAFGGPRGALDGVGARSVRTDVPGTPRSARPVARRVPRRSRRPPSAARWSETPVSQAQQVFRRPAARRP